MKSKPAEVMGNFNCLYIQTPVFLLQLDLKNSSNSVPFSAMEELPPWPTVALKCDGVSYPVGMGVFQSKSDIYFLGGEYLKKDEEFEFLSQRAHGSNTVFKFLPGDNRLEEDSRMPMISGKTGPIVEFIEGKIYVLQSSPLYGLPMDCPATHTTFEVLDVSDAFPVWKGLESPPFYDDGKDIVDSTVIKYFSVGNKFYCLTRALKLYYFDTCNESWDEEKNLSKVCNMSDVMIPHDGRKLSEDVILAFKDDLKHIYAGLGPKLYLIGYLYSNDGCLLAYQIINYLDLFPVELYGYPRLLISMEDGKFCAITIGHNADYTILYDRKRGPIKVLAVSIFTVRKLTRADEIQASPSAAAPAASDNFLSVQVEKNYIFPIDDNYYMRGAFFA